MITINNSTINLHFPPTRADDMALISESLIQIMTTQTELAAALDALTTKAAKIGAETTSLLTKITELTDELAGSNLISPAVEEKLAALQAQMGIVDDLVKDEPAA